MTTIIREVVFDADPESAWDALRDFGAVQSRLAPGFVTDCRMEDPSTRVVTFFNGAVARERCIGIDEGARRLAYSVVESGLGMSHNNSAAQVLDDGGGRTRFVWTVDVLPDEVATPLAAMMDAGLAAIRAHLEQDRTVR